MIQNLLRRKRKYKTSNEFFRNMRVKMQFYKRTILKFEQCLLKRGIDANANDLKNNNNTYY
jgi:hypothetical protein